MLPPESTLGRLWMVLATGFGSGYSRFAPGTCGSVVGLVLATPVLWLSPLWIYGAVTLVCILIGTVAANHAEQVFRRKDPGAIVIDEIAGIFVTFLWVPPTVFNLVLGFALFRLFDITKPQPCRWAERAFAGGWGVMADDLIAGAYACGTLHLILYGVARLTGG